MTVPAVSHTAFSVRLSAVTEIDAPAELAWSVLADTASYGAWNPFVRRLEGALIPGGRLEVDLQLEGRKLQTMRPRLISVEPGRAFEWLGQVGPRGVFDGRHRFEIRPLADGRCELVQSEVLSGLLVPMFRAMLTGPTPAAFVALNDAFRARVDAVGRGNV